MSLKEYKEAYNNLYVLFEELNESHLNMGRLFEKCNKMLSETEVELEKSEHEIMVRDRALELMINYDSCDICHHYGHDGCHELECKHDDAKKDIIKRARKELSMFTTCSYILSHEQR